MSEKLEQSTVRRMRVASVLTDPKPNFVSLVSHGANQTPFSAVKMAEGSGSTQEVDQLITKETFMANKDIDVRKITFSVSEFPDEGAVKAYLDNAGFTASAVKDGDMFVVTAGDVDGVDLVSIDAEKGVTYFVAEVDKSEGKATKSEDTSSEAGSDKDKEAATNDDATNDAPKGAEATSDSTSTKSFMFPDMDGSVVTQKFDMWCTLYSDATSVENVLQEGADGLPLGLYELNEAMTTALSNALKTGDYDAARGVVAEFGDLVIRLAQAVEAATIDYSCLDKAFAEKRAKGTEGTAVEKTDDATTDGTNTNDADATNDETKNSESASTIDELVKAMKAMEARLSKHFTDSLAEEAKKTAKTAEELGKSVKEQNERLVEIEKSRSQIRKGADEDTSSGTLSEPARKSSRDNVLLGNTFGFRRKNHF